MHFIISSVIDISVNADIKSWSWRWHRNVFLLRGIGVFLYLIIFNNLPVKAEVEVQVILHCLTEAYNLTEKWIQI